MLLGFFCFLFLIIAVAWMGYRNAALSGYTILIVFATVWFCRDMTSSLTIQL